MRKLNDLITEATRQISKIINLNEELYLAQIIKVNTDFNPINYRLCHTNYFDDEGKHIFNIWLEEIK